jgi:hypothetical protein
VAATPSQKQTLESLLTEVQAQGVLIAAQTVAIQALASDQLKIKDFQRWQAEYLAGANTELADIEAGTHVF